MKGGSKMEHNIQDFNKTTDIDLIMEIWLKSNVEAHHFILENTLYKLPIYYFPI